MWIIVCMCACVYVSMYTCVYMYQCMYVCTCINVHTYAHVHNVSMYACVLYVYQCTYIHMHVCTCNQCMCVILPACYSHTHVKWMRSIKREMKQVCSVVSERLCRPAPPLGALAAMWLQCMWLACCSPASKRWEDGVHRVAGRLLCTCDNFVSPLPPSLPAHTQRQLDDVVLCCAYVYFEKIILMVCA